MPDTREIQAELEVEQPVAGSVVGSAVAEVTRESGVLVVEDDPDMQWRLARMLTVQGARVVGTSSGEAALALIEQWPADLVLVDQGLPGISGLEVARRIRQRHPGIPVVLMSAEESSDLRLAAKVAGAVEMLIKPFRVETLSGLLERVRSVGVKLVVESLGADAADLDLAPAE
jgi:DNA-binding response OmpR family regulator